MNAIGHFSVWGDFQLSDVSRALDMQPSQSWPKGDLSLDPDTPAKIATWDLHCPVDLEANEQVDYLIGVLWPKRESVTMLAEHYTAELNVTTAGVLNLKPDVLQKLSELGVGVNCFVDGDLKEVSDAD